jgi:hypothetical protein
MKKIFSIVITALFLSVLSFNFVLAEDTSTSTDDTATTTTEEDTTTAVDDELTTTSTAATAETATDESTSFLDSIDTVWLWVILGVGGAVLIGSLIGIISLSKKEKTETSVAEEIKPVESAPQTTTVVDEKKEEIPVQQPAPQEAPIVTETIPEEAPKVEEIPSIKETLGDTSAYQQPESNEQIVSNIAPTVDVNKDLEDINMATQQEATEPAVSTIETPVIEPTPVQEQPQSNGLDMMNNMPLSQEAPVQTPETASMPNPQNPESVQTTQNPSDQGLNQPVDTTSL